MSWTMPVTKTVESSTRRPRDGVRRLSRLAGLALLMSATNLFAQPTLDLWVSIEDNVVSIRAHNVPIRQVLAEIARQVSLDVATSDSLSERVSMDLEGVSLSRAMRKILKGHSYQLSDAAGRQGRAARLWILSAEPDSFASGAARLDLMSPAPAVMVTLGEEAPAVLENRALHDPDPLVRAEAVYALSESANTHWQLSALRQALADPSPTVRESAIEALADIGGSESASALEVALHDVEVSIRLEAVEALGEIGGETAAALLQQALSEEATRETAAELLAPTHEGT